MQSARGMIKNQLIPTSIMDPNNQINQAMKKSEMTGRLKWIGRIRIGKHAKCRLLIVRTMKMKCRGRLQPHQASGHTGRTIV